MADHTTIPGGTATLAGRAIARIGYGAMALERFDDDREAGAAFLRHAVELGVDHIDTAEFYGDGVANDVIRRAIGSSDAVAVVSKVGAVRVDAPIPLVLAQRPEELRAQVEANLRTLGRDRLDVVNLRRPEIGPGLTVPDEDLVDLDDQLAEMTAMRDEGLIGGIGLSAVRIESLRRALPVGVVCVQNAYSLVAREFEAMLTLCVAEDIAWVPFFPLGSGFPGLPKVTDEPAVQRIAAELGASPAQVGLAWLLGHAPNTLLIPGTANADHLAENLAAGAVELTAEQTAALDALAPAAGAQR
ncbi:aldo/keto reductase [Curtobacterium sp. MCBD17_034]|uniref:aldo/keto reductase n=1 Tax=unclassified Curtobacterium TaxID=257496 RepID=UPI000DA932B2|nr:MULTISPECIES: aldo/keto reductase [unclassified Curtobacterium]PZF60424.1 aldo/keto reductase [Curtobacterium sp. MCBD17_034]PZM35114.1 aldo/keto reductase [Curtobacterium sp. MCBD17_031]WIB67187.1 aldo/keto reductase [Curtobacterium sp. MCBD17_035]